MDDYSITSLTESKNEWCARLVSILTHHITEGIHSIFDEAAKLCLDNNEENKYLMTFQNLLSTIPNWNSNTIETERKRIETTSGCKYLEDLVTCVHIIQLKALTCIRVGQKQKKINIDVPSIDKFIHQIYINTARRLYTNIYLFEKDLYPLQIQKNNRELEIIIKEAILTTIRDNIPVEQILRNYMDETEEQEIVHESGPKTESSQEKVPVDLSLNPVLMDNKLENLAKQIETDKNAPSKNVEEIKPDLVQATSDFKTTLSDDLPTSLTSPSKLSIDFSNIDNVIEPNGREAAVDAPKDLETLNKISEINNTKRKIEDAEDDKLTIGNDIDLNIGSISLDKDPILGNIVNL
jgi:hypothetical protein